MSKSDLTNKERYIVWAIVTWFNFPATSELKGKLYPGIEGPERARYQRLYDRKIEDRIIELGPRLEELRRIGKI